LASLFGPDEAEVDKAANLIVPWRMVSWISTAVAIVALATLATVASIHNADALATVALALALLSFVVQILVFLGQALTQQQQAVRSEEIYARTLELLSEVHAKTETTQEAMREQREVLLPALLSKAKLQPEAVGAEDAGSQVPQPVDYPPATATPEDEEIVEHLTTLPESREEAEQAAQLLDGLDDDHLTVVHRFGTDEIRSRTPESTLAPGLYARGDLIEPLVASGLVDRVPGWTNPNTLSNFYRLTPAGRDAARMLTAEGPRPDYYEDIGLPSGEHLADIRAKKD
jgi:hypothetical protein